MTPAEERAQMRKGLSVLRADIDNWTATVDLSIKQAEDRLDAMAAEDASAAESESAAIVKALVASARNVVRECRAGSSEEYRALGDLEKALDALQTESTKPGPLESVQVRPDFFRKNEPQTFEERVGGVPKDAPWFVEFDMFAHYFDIDDATGDRIAQVNSQEDARLICNLVNNLDRIVGLIEAARRVVGNAERMKDPNAGMGLVLALAALDEAEVLK